MGREYSLPHCFAHGRVKTNRTHQFSFGGLQSHGSDEALDHLGELGPDDVCAHELARLGLENGLDEALGVARGDGLVVVLERETVNITAGRNNL